MQATESVSVDKLGRKPSRSSSATTRATGLCAAAWIGVLLAGCSVSEGPGWKLVGQLTDGLETQFVEVAKEKAQSRATYDEAVAALCPRRDICVIGFFQAGDHIPVTQDARTFFANGGFTNYPVLAVWWSNRSSGLAEFSKWDCIRAGDAGAPLSALCGPGVSESYEAVLAVAGRVGMAESCGWPADDGKAAVAKFLTSVADVERRRMFQKGYDRLYDASRDGPDDVADCRRLRRKIEDETRNARKVLKTISLAENSS